MKTTLNSLLVTAAGLALSAAAAYGQEKVVANVPFAFHTVAGVRAPGEYVITRANADGSVLRLQSTDAHRNSLLGMAIPVGQASNSKPKLVFKCGDESGCFLSEVWTADGHGWSYKAHLKPYEAERIAVVYFESRNAE